MSGEQPAEHARPRVLYVMGAGRSGSSTLGITLGNCDGVFYAGELDNWLVRSGIPQVEDPERLRFWEKVRNELSDPAAAESLFGNESQRAIERSASLLRINKWGARRRLRRRYRAVAEDLYGAVTRAAGVGALADTSHYPLRARELQHLNGVELHLLFLVRDPQGVVASFNRQDVGEFTKSTLHTNVYLWVTNLLSIAVFLKQPRSRRLLVRYEDFLADPAATVARILALGGAPPSAPPDFSALEIGFPLQGNRVTRSRTISLKPSTDPVTHTSAITRLAQGPVMAVLRRLRPAAAGERAP
jgi:Sulfotransferase family